jgi:excinuclease UvrABC nuclease subunit
LNLALEELSPIQTNEMWQNADKGGIYFLFNKEKVLQYIGKASFASNIGVRIGERFSSKDCRCLVDKFSSITLLATIALPEGRIFEASSIEEYFIHKLQPPLNVIGAK